MAQAANEIRILSTGIGLEDRIHHDDYSLKLTFSMRKGSYLADIHVVIYKDTRQKVIESVSKGPWLFVGLAAGEYTVVAKRKDGAMQSAKFTIIGKKQTAVVLSWKE